MFKLNTTRIAQLEADVAKYKQDISELQELINKEYSPALVTAAIDHLKAANAALVDVYKSKWSFFGAIFPIVTILLTATFAYQIWKVDELKKIEERSNTAVLAVESSAKAAVGQANILGRFSGAMSFLNIAYRESARERHSLAAKQALRAISDLQAAQFMIDNLPGDKSNEVSTVKTSLGLTAKQILLAAYELRARSYFHIYENTTIGGVNGERKKLEYIFEAARNMIEVDPKRWEGYHWLGLYYSFIGNHEEGQKQLEKALEYDLDTKIDSLNIAEIYFITERFDKLAEVARTYMNYDNDAPVESYLVAKFYERVSQVILKNDLTQMEKYNDDIGKRRGFRKNTEFSNIITFAQGIGRTTLLKCGCSSEQQDTVKGMVKLLIESATNMPSNL